MIAKPMEKQTFPERWSDAPALHTTGGAGRSLTMVVVIVVVVIVAVVFMQRPSNPDDYMCHRGGGGPKSCLRQLGWAQRTLLQDRPPDQLQRGGRGP